MRCDTCRHYELTESECRRLPPTTVKIVVGKYAVETHADIIGMNDALIKKRRKDHDA